MAITDFLALFWQFQDNQKGHEKDNLGSGLRHRYRRGSDNGIWVRSSPIAFDLSRWEVRHGKDDVDPFDPWLRRLPGFRL